MNFFTHHLPLGLPVCLFVGLFVCFSSFRFLYFIRNADSINPIQDKVKSRNVNG